MLKKMIDPGMDDAEQFVRDLASFEDQMRRNRLGRRAVSPAALDNWRRQTKEALRRIRRLFRRNPDPPGDPYAYVRAPRKPKPSHLTAAAAADKHEW
jgi:hypothetical protein